MKRVDCMGREEAIRVFISHLDGYDIAGIIESIASYSGEFADLVWLPMYMLNECLEGKTPTEIIGMLNDGFNVNDDYFRYDAYGRISSANDYMREHEALEYVEEVIDYCIRDDYGRTGYPELDGMIYAPGDTLFNDYYEEVDPEELEQED